MNYPSTGWAADWLAQLEQEETALEAALESVRQAGTALAANDQSALLAALAAEEKVVASVNDAAARGQSLRTRLMADLSLDPKGFSVAMLHQQLWPALRPELAERIKRVRHLVLLVEHQNHHNAYVARQCLQSVRATLRATVGKADTGARYSAAGVSRDTVSGSVLDTQG